jgi:hypothetical protein
MTESNLRERAAGIRSRVVHVIGQAGRISAGPAVVRLIAAVAALVALMLSVPTEYGLAARLSLLAVPVAAGVGLFPRTRWVTVVAVVAVLAWLTSTIGFDDAVALWRVALLAAALYLMHAAAAMAAVLPHDSIVPGRILVRWAGRVGAVLGVGLVLGVGGMAIVSQLSPVQSLVGPIVGSLVAAGLTGLLAWHLRRPSE